MYIRSLALIAFLCLTLTACDSTEEFEIGGTYSGTSQDGPDDFNDNLLTIPTTADGDTFTFRFTTTERDGSGTVFSESTFDGTGTYDYPEITLTVEGDALDGTVSADGDRITLREGDDVIVVLTRD